MSPSTIRGKANVVADALSRKSREDLTCLSIREWNVIGNVSGLGLDLNDGG